jgi:hypothetical protein
LITLQIFGGDFKLWSSCYVSILLLSLQTFFI